MRLSAIAGIAAAIVCAVAPAVAQTPFRDVRWGFEVTLPDGWVGERADSDFTRAWFAGPDNAAMCGVTAVDEPSLAGDTQAEIDRRMASGAYNNEVADEHRRDGIEALSARGWPVDHDGRKALRGESVIIYEGVRVRAHKLLVAVPGRAYNVNCIAPDADFAKWEADIAALIASFRVIKPVI